MAAFGGPERDGLRAFPAEAVACGLSLNSADSGAGTGATRAALLTLPGTGPWTAGAAYGPA